ncbi:MAG: hypothetical protein ACP5NV_02070 [Candidatus Woesearchaeota archaeon]
MRLVDVIHLERDYEITAYFKKELEQKGNSYYSFNNLESLEEYIADKNWASQYIINSHFPIKKDLILVDGEYNHFHAIKSIQELHTTRGLSRPEIIIYSGILGMPSMENVLFISKFNNSTRDLLEILKERIKTKPVSGD